MAFNSKTTKKRGRGAGHPEPWKDPQDRAVGAGEWGFSGIDDTAALHVAGDWRHGDVPAVVPRRILDDLHSAWADAVLPGVILSHEVSHVVESVQSGKTSEAEGFKRLATLLTTAHVKFHTEFDDAYGYRLDLRRIRLRASEQRRRESALAQSKG